MRNWEDRGAGILLGGGAKPQGISHCARILAPFEMTGTVGQFY